MFYLTKTKLLFSLLILFLSVTGMIMGQETGRHFRKETYKLPALPNIIEKLGGPYLSPMSIIKQNFWLTLRDNVQLDASKFYPSQPNPYLPNGYPVVIMVHGYGDRKETLEGFASAQAQYGYVVYTYSMRGQGNSGGLSNLISRTEALDLIEFVNYVKHDGNATGSDTSKIMIMGGSQGGMIPYMAASMGMNVRAIISALASPDFATSWIENGCIKMTLLWTIEYTPDTARYSPLVDRMSDWIYSKQRDKWDSLARYLPIDRDFSNIIGNNRVPIVLENSWQDMFFNARGNIEHIPFMSAPSRYYFGAVMGHGGDVSWNEDQWHMNFFNEWFFYWLFGYENNILTRPRFHYAYTTFPVNNGMWSFVHDSSYTWPPAQISNYRLYFTANSKLRVTPNANQNAANTLKNTIKNSYTMMQIVYDEFKGTRFKNNFIKDSIVYESLALANSVKMIGTPTMSLDYQSNAAVNQFNFQIFEVTSSGVSKFITSVNYTDRNNTINTRKTVTIPGNSHAHIFQKNSKIRVVMTNLDKRWNYPFLATNPYVLPVMTNFNNKLFLSSNSFIDLPLISTNAEKLFASENEEGSESKEGNSFILSQNSPNPFNPVTRINFTIPEYYTGRVSLNVYDIAGRHVQTLLNSELSGGNYSATFDGTMLASGVYFYKLNAGNYSTVKRMLLIK